MVSSAISSVVLLTLLLFIGRPSRSPSEATVPDLAGAKGNAELFGSTSYYDPDRTTCPFFMVYYQLVRQCLVEV